MLLFIKSLGARSFLVPSCVFLMIVITCVCVFQVKGGDKAKKQEFEVLKKVSEVLNDGKHIRMLEWNDVEIEELNKHLLITAKPLIYLVNMSEKDYIRKKNKWYDFICCSLFMAFIHLILPKFSYQTFCNGRSSELELNVFRWEISFWVGFWVYTGKSCQQFLAEKSFSQRQFRWDFMFLFQLSLKTELVYDIAFNCSWRKLIAIIVNVCLFYAKFSLDNFDFSSDFYALDVLRDLKFSLNHNFKQLNSIGGILILKVNWKVRQNWCHFLL